MLHLKRITSLAAEARKRCKIDPEDLSSGLEQDLRVLDQESEVSCGSSSDELVDDSSSDSDDNGNDSDNSSNDDGERTSPSTKDLQKSVDQDNVLKWTNSAGASLRVTYTGESRMTEWRKQRRQNELRQEASKSLSIAALFQRQKDLNLSMKHRECSEAINVTPISKLERGKPPSLTEKQEVRHKALQDLKRLLELKTEQIKKYGRVLSTSSCFYRRHLMVMSFFWIQERRKEFPNIDRRGLAKIVASTNRKGSYTGTKIIQWERSWIKDRIIPDTKAGKHNHCVSWMDDEGVLIAVRDFARSQGEGYYPN